MRSKGGFPFHFHGMLLIACWTLLLHVVPVLWFIGLPGPPPEDSLRVPRDGGLLPSTIGMGLLLASFPGAEVGSRGMVYFRSFFPSAIKLPTTTYSERSCAFSFLQKENRETNKFS